MTSPNSETGAGRSSGVERPTPGFTFANKRKISPDGTPVARPEPDSAAESAADSPAVAAAGQSAEEVDAMLRAADQVAAERLSDLQRLQAEYANYRKRVERDRGLARDLTIATVVESLLPVLDDIHLARQHGDLESGPFASIAEKLESILAKYGVERFGEPGAAFDPEVHDALMHVDEELAEGTDTTTVVGVLQPGYRIGERVIRPARVSVADPQ
jgi:molecular chaperone GrpE